MVNPGRHKTQIPVPANPFWRKPGWEPERTVTEFGMEKR